jgi:hypothetical protein
MSSSVKEATKRLKEDSNAVDIHEKQTAKKPCKVCLALYWAHQLLSVVFVEDLPRGTLECLACSQKKESNPSICPNHALFFRGADGKIVPGFELNDVELKESEYCGYCIEDMGEISPTLRISTGSILTSVLHARPHFRNLLRDSIAMSPDPVLLLDIEFGGREGCMSVDEMPEFVLFPMSSFINTEGTDSKTSCPLISCDFYKDVSNFFQYKKNPNPRYSIASDNDSLKELHNRLQDFLTKHDAVGTILFYGHSRCDQLLMNLLDQLFVKKGLDPLFHKLVDKILEPKYSFYDVHSGVAKLFLHSNLDVAITEPRFYIKDLKLDTINSQLFTDLAGKKTELPANLSISGIPREFDSKCTIDIYRLGVLMAFANWIVFG